ncbi:hypothetical protein L195_g026352, partial [Trifolium pratense]
GEILAVAGGGSRGDQDLGVELDSEVYAIVES